MLISKLPDQECEEKNLNLSTVEDDSHEYQTANELFDLMSKNQNFDLEDENALTPGELVLLYESIDRGTKLMSDAKDMICASANQRIETVVYEGVESDSSELSDVVSDEDLHSVILINKEQMDFLNVQPFAEHTLCHKYGDFELETSFNNDYIFQDPFINEQLRGCNLVSINKDINCSSFLPPSLLDYICCKRLEDSYNFYMENIIRYVKNTIDQLKRISNGDYLTANAKKKWKEVENVNDSDCNNTKVLATSTNIPLHVECKVNGFKPTWDDIVHSAVDIRSLSKILENKIIVEIPKFINGSYTLLSRYRNDNLIISCKKDQSTDDSRVDVVLKLKRSETGHVTSEISSIMVLQNTPTAQGSKASKIPLPIIYKPLKNITYDQNDGPKLMQLNSSCKMHEDDIKDIELNSSCKEQDDDVKVIESESPPKNNDDYVKAIDLSNPTQENFKIEEGELTWPDGCFELHPSNSSINGGEVYPKAEVLQPRRRQNRKALLFTVNHDKMTKSKSNIVIGSHREELEVGQALKSSFDLPPDDLKITIKSLGIQGALPEESIEDIPQPLVAKRSPTRIRIKSPYENQSYVIEEKKRKKLLEIREKREKRKKAQIENCKISKSKYDYAGAMPQASTSVTKLSITNKSFYNSIYGDSTNVEAKQTKNKNRKRDGSKEVSDRNPESRESKAEICEAPPEIKTHKFISRSYYLDDTVTEMMYMNMKQQEKEKEISSPSTSGVSFDLRSNLNIISQLIIPFSSTGNVTDELDTQTGFSEHTSKIFIDSSDVDSNGQSYVKNYLATTLSKLNVVPSNTPKNLINENNTNLQIECRKSIDKIYQLMNKRDRDPQNSGCKTQNAVLTIDMAAVEGSTHESESGTSLKHQISSSRSTFSFDKPNNEVPAENTRTPRNVVPKVIISTRSPITQTIKNSDVDQNRKDRRLLNVNTKIRDKHNPLKAISQLLHEFENVQRNRTKPRTEQKCFKNPETPVTQDIKQNPFQWSHRRKSRLEHNETLDVPANGPPAKTAMTLDNVKVPFQQIPFDAKITHKNVRKKIYEIFDEAKEARGEAVKGPSRFNSRLNSLAQPKKSYVQAHSEEYQTRYGRNLITDRLQRLAGTPPPPVLEKTPRLVNSANRYNKGKRIGNQSVTPVALKNQTGLSIEKGSKAHCPNNSSPDQNKQALFVVGQSYKHTNVPEPPQILRKYRKMVAVESYVKNHYGRSPPIAEKPQKARAPVLPSYIDAGSSSNNYMHQESTEVGSKLHDIIESMLNYSTKNIESRPECSECETVVNSKSSRDNNADPLIDDFSHNRLSSQCEEIIPLESEEMCKAEHCNTMMNTADDITKLKKEQRFSAGEIIHCKNYDKQSSKSATTIEKTEDLSNTRLSMVALSEHRKIKKNNLTPNTSLQKLLFLQSGDAGSQMVRLDLSRKLLSENFSNLNLIRSLSKPSWDFPVITEPVTLAYVLPKYDKDTFQEVVSPSLTHVFQQVSKEASLNVSCVKRQNTVDISVIHNESLLNLENCATDNNQCDNNEKPQSVLCEQLATRIELLNPMVPCTNLRYLNFNTSNDNSCPVNRPLLTNENKATLSSEVIKKKANQTQTNCVKEKNENSDMSKNSETADYTASLDILMGLLNEIQKITTCQNSYITKNKTEGSKELEMILNNSSGMVNSIRSTYNFSISSLDKLRCLESDQSVYSFYISERDLINDGLDNYKIKPALQSQYSARNILYKPICADKEVAVNISNVEYKDKLINVPSIFPITINQSTHMSNVVLEKLCDSANQSVLTVTEYHSKYSEASIYSGAYSNKIIEVLPQRNDQGPSFKNHPGHKKGGDKKTLKPKARSIKEYAIVKNKESTKSADHDLCVENVKFDPVMKLKRDLLVTVYSMLVLAVFAALSFPEMMYYVV